ncbi:MAG TPA: response regulator, partial [Gammaproteobacteria bacterium]|nr:response regulator [Gammaproteobacteria bacterium]
ILDETADIRVVGEASSGEEAVERARSLKPQVILMDVSMPGIGGLEATRKLAMSLPDTRIIVISAQTAEPYPMKLLEAGASGYLTKDSAGDEIVTAIRRVLAGERYISADIARQLAMQAVNKTSGSPFDQLSSREMQVMIMATGGHSVQAISGKLHLSPKTVSTYRSRLFQKLGVNNDVELTRLALRYGVIEEKTGGKDGA